MYFTKETKERFIRMIEARQIMVISRRLSKSNNYEHKFIGATSDGKWDFTPLVAETTGCKTNGGGIRNLTCRGQYPDVMAYNTFCAAQGETGIKSDLLFDDVANNLTYFSM